MIVGEALSRRADVQRRLAQVQDRLHASVLVREGDEPPESPDALLAEIESLCDELQRLIATINHTNANVRLPTGETVTEALARRDVLARRRGALRKAADAATNKGYGSLLRSEVRMVRQIRVADVQVRVDALAREQRELDTLLQQHNWTTSLHET